MPDYRASNIGPDGQITNVHTFTAADRREAAWVAVKLVVKAPLELWEGDEYIGTFKPGNPGFPPTFKRPPQRR